MKNSIYVRNQWRKSPWWMKMVQDWPDNAYHHLVDSLPEFLPQFEYVYLRRVDEIGEEAWRAGYPLSRETNSSGVSIWQEQRLSQEELAFVRDTHYPLRVGNIVDDCVAYVDVSRANIQLFLPLFHSADRAKLQWMCSKELPSLPEVTMRQKDKPFYLIHVELISPMVLGIVVTKGTGKEMTRHETTDSIYIICRDSLRTPVEVDSAIKYNLLQAILRPSDNIDFLDKNYYLQHMVSYSAWSYPIHKAQVKAILNFIPKTKTIVAPGDGLGIVKKNWDGPVICGDVASQDPNIPRETFTETLHRARKDPQGRCGVLFLSFVTSLMTQSEVAICSHWEGPVVWLDAHDRPPFKMEQQARHLWTHGIKVPGPLSAISEPRKELQTMLYSENLLQLPQITYYKVKNEAVLYWEAMRPFAHAIDANSTTKHTMVVYSLSDYIKLKDRGIENIYVASLGRSDPDVRDLVLRSYNELSVRTIYRCDGSSALAPFIVQHYQTYLDRGMLYFCMGHDRKVVHSYNIGTFNVKFSFVRTRVQLPPVIEIVGIKPGIIVANTLFGLRYILIPTHRELYVFQIYLSTYEPDQYIKLKDFEYKSEQELKSMGFDEVRSEKMYKSVLGTEECDSPFFTPYDSRVLSKPENKYYNLQFWMYDIFKNFQD